MSVTGDEVRRIAELARLAPDTAEVERLTRELNRILEHVDALREADVSGVQEGMGDGLPDAFRDPTAPPDPIPPDAPQGMAPGWREGFFLVPRLPALEEEG
jgi:aspartyl-tRNA(Asn)/glutamyl-tRNA(Gln) amidotransferase subunit C